MDGTTQTSLIEDYDLDILKALRTEEAPAADEVVTLHMVPVADLVIDRSYQRRVSASSRTRLRRIVREFTWTKFGALTVARVPEGFAVIDGQHRAIAAQAVRAQFAPAVIVESDLRGQAEDFVGINSVRTSVASIDKFRARVAAEDPNAVVVAEIMDELEISSDVAAGASIGPKETRAVSLLEKLVKRIGRGQLYTTLETLLDAQPGQANLLTAFAIEATSMCVDRVIDREGDLDRLVDVIGELDFETLKMEAAQLVHLTDGRTAARGYQLIMKAYDKGLHRKIGPT